MSNFISDRDLYNYFIPVIWPANHMGSFLMNLLFDGEYESTTMDPITYEWHRRDSLHNTFGDGRLPLILTSYIKKILLTDYIDESTVIKLAFNLNINYSQDELIQVIKGNTNIEELVNNTPSNFLIDRDKLLSSFKYLKMHHYKPIEGATRSFDFSKKIFVHYPENKSWIPTILGWHKCHKDFRINEMHGQFAGHSFEEFKRNVLPNATDSDISIDMYNLVIKRDLGAILNVIPDFKCTRDKLLMLDIAHHTTLKILNKFDMDYKIDIPMNLEYSEFLKKYNLDPYKLSM
jgi:hypothetical protein